MPCLTRGADVALVLRGGGDGLSGGDLTAAEVGGRARLGVQQVDLVVLAHARRRHRAHRWPRNTLLHNPPGGASSPRGTTTNDTFASEWIDQPTMLFVKKLMKTGE